MKNLFSRFVEVWIVGPTGQKQRVIPHYLGQPIPWVDNGEVVSPLRLTLATKFTPTPVRAGEEVWVEPGTYTGTGPIEFVGQLKLNGVVVLERTNMTPFSVVFDTAGEVEWVGQASGLHPSDPPPEVLKLNVLAPDIPNPVLTVSPSISPASGEVGDEYNINPGEGIGLTWVLMLDQINVTADVISGVYIPDRSGQLVLTSNLYDRGKTTTVSVEATVAAIPDDGWNVVGGPESITFNSMPTPTTLSSTGGTELIIFEEV